MEFNSNYNYGGYGGQYQQPNQFQEPVINDSYMDEQMTEQINRQCDQLVEEQTLLSGGTKVSMKDFEMICIIGKGSYGKVTLVKKKDTQQLYAIKELKKADIIKRNQVEHTMTERRILEKVRNPFIIRMDFAFQSKTKLFFVLEYCPGGELFFYLQQIGRFKEDAVRFYASNILLALQHLHSQDILYRDLKPENVLVGQDGYAKIADFGLSKENIRSDNDAKSLCGTAEYLAPEILERKGHGKSSDWWAFGSIIYEMLCGQPPFFSKDKEQLFKSIRYDQPKLDFPFLSDQARDLCSRLMDKNPLTRLGAGPSDAQEIMAHPWFASINWFSIANKQVTPPYKPQLENPHSTKHFSEEFTRMQMTPQDMASLVDDNTEFQKFTYEDESALGGDRDRQYSFNV